MSRSGRLLVAVAIVAIVGLAAKGGVFKDFSSFEFYDDEGYMMLSLRHVLDGNRLYGDVRVPYGPAYYLEKWIVHGALAVPLTHAAVRRTTATLRVSAAGLAGVAAARIAGNVPLGALTFLVVHRNFMQLGEPGHPQELSVLLLMALPACASFARRRPAASVFGLGFLVATLLMVKVNLGAFAALAVGAALAATLASGALRTALRAASLLGGLALPYALIGFRPDWTQFVAAATTWVVGLTPWSLQPGRDSANERLLLVGAAGGAVALAAICAFAFFCGGSFATMFDQLIVAPRAVYAIPLPFGMPVEPAAIADSAVGAVAAIVSAVAVARWGVRGTGRWLLAGGALALGSFTLPNAWAGAIPRLPLAIAPWVWIVIAAGNDRPWAERLSRQVLAWLAVLAPLQVYPVAGSQQICGALPGVLCGAVAFGDGLFMLAAPLRESLRAVATATAGVVLLAVALAGSYADFSGNRATYRAEMRLDLPGTGPLRLSAPRVAVLGQLCAAIREQCDVLLTLPGFQSLHFWTGIGPPTVDLIAHGSHYLDDARIAAIATAMRAARRPCVVRRPDVWNPPPDPRVATQIMPLVPTEEVFGEYVLFR